MISNSAFWAFFERIRFNISKIGAVYKLKAEIRKEYLKSVCFIGSQLYHVVSRQILESVSLSRSRADIDSKKKDKYLCGCHPNFKFGKFHGQFVVVVRVSSSI